MPRIRKEPNRYWTKEEKLRIINRVVKDALSTNQVAKEEAICPHQNSFFFRTRF